MRPITRVRLLLVSLLVCAPLVSSFAEQDHEAPWQRSCDSFASAREFVRESSSHCLRQQHQKRCEREARAFFEECRFDGDYERISARIHARMLFVFALATSGPVAEGGES